MMASQIFHIIVFWIVVIAAIRLCAWFPDSLPARALFARQGPVRGRGESDAAYRLRCARFHGGWLGQAALLFIVGAAARVWDTALGESLAFVVLWAVVIPALGTAAFVAATIDLGCAFVARRRERGRAGPAQAPSPAAHP